MNRFLSQKFRFYSFVCIALLLFVHGYNLKNTYLEPFSIVKERLTFTTFFEYFIANGILRFRLPLLFAISGYIYAMQDYKQYAGRIQNRFKTLMVPYFIWSAVGLLITFVWQQFPFTAQAVYDSQLDQLGDNRPYAQIGWEGVIKRWILKPVSFQLWFIRSLFIYNLAYPVFRWGIMNYTRLWFLLMFLLWIFMFRILFFEGQGMLFFSLGIWLYKYNYPIERKPGWYSRYLSWLFFFGLNIIKTFMAFEFEETNRLTITVFILLHVSSVMAGVIAIWYSGDAVVRWFVEKKWFLWVCSFSFIIYGLHIPLLAYVMRLAYRFGSNIPFHRLIFYITVPLVVLFFCIAAGALFRKFWPKAYKISTGGRGF
jgi:fucose 4-O-acetylase-like acetyltransferase